MKKSSILGKISSLETMGLVDGPGIRFVVFMQGCPLRCIYCHNPETWAGKATFEITPADLVEKILRYKNYFGKDGGVTFSGGEPLVQKDFLLECLKICKKEGINTAIDTAGGIDNDYDEILDLVDLVIMDIKAYKKEDYKKITGKDIENSLKFLYKCQQKNKKMWLRTVIVPGINDSKGYILGLKNFIKDLKNIEKVELLPYHTYGEEKYIKLKIPYKLKGIKAMDQQKCNQLQELLNK